MIRRLAISDWHWPDQRLQPPLAYAFINKVVAKVQKNLIILGDLAEFYTFPEHYALNTAFGLMRYIDVYLPPTASIIYLVGNHDERVAEIAPLFPRTTIIDSKGIHQLDENTFICHGYHWDPFNWTYNIADIVNGGKAVRWITRQHNDRFAGHKGNPDRYIKKRAKAIKKLPQYSTLLSGHTHRAHVLHDKNKLSIDVGSGVKGAVEYAADKGNGWELCRFPS